MAEIAVQYEKLSTQAVSYKWETIGEGDSGQPVECVDYLYRTITVEGTFGGTTITIQGRNDASGTWATLKDSLGNDLSFTSATEPKLIGVIPRFIRPLSTSGSGTDVDVVMVAVKQ